MPTFAPAFCLRCHHPASSCCKSPLWETKRERQYCYENSFPFMNLLKGSQHPQGPLNTCWKLSWWPHGPHQRLVWEWAHSPVWWVRHKGEVVGGLQENSCSRRKAYERVWWYLHVIVVSTAIFLPLWEQKVYMQRGTAKGWQMWGRERPSNEGWARGGVGKQEPEPGSPLVQAGQLGTLLWGYELPDATIFSRTVGW